MGYLVQGTAAVSETLIHACVHRLWRKPRSSLLMGLGSYFGSLEDMESYFGRADMQSYGVKRLDMSSVDGYT